ncbi:MAG: FMN-binding protein [Thermonemataceae bacterium]
MDGTEKRTAPKKHKRQKKKALDNWLAWLTLTLLIVCGVIGFKRTRVDLSQFKKALWPPTVKMEALGYESTQVKDATGTLVGYTTTGTFNGFGGPLKVAVAVDTAGTIQNLAVVEHRETPSWYNRVIESNFLEGLRGKNYKDPLRLGQDVDAISGATYTTNALTEATKEATLKAAKEWIGKDITPYVTPRKIKIGLPEISLVALLLIATIGVYKIPKQHQNTMKWVLWILGAAFIGFTFNHPLTLVDVNKLLMGYWPDVYNQLYWYLLIFGIVLIFLTTGKNTYCKYVCPFGAVQECVGAVGGAKTMVSRKYNRLFNWTRRIVVLLAIMLALEYRNPGMSSYEVYGTIFNLLGSNFELFFLSLVLVFALFIKRPWCNYLCPIPVIEHYARFVYKQVKTSITSLKLPLTKKKVIHPTKS